MSVLGLSCIQCGAEYPLEPLFYGCTSCDSANQPALTVTYDYKAIASKLNIDQWAKYNRGIWRFDALLPLQNPKVQISLGEGNTALCQPQALCEATGLKNLYIKNETTNPTMAFKDRFHASSISMAKFFDYSRITASTTGNHGASAAAYSAAANIDSCIVLCHPESSQLQRDMIGLYGGQALILEDRFQHLDLLVREYEYYPSTTMTPMPVGTPFGIEGYKTIAFEIYLQLNCSIPNRMFCPIAAGDALYGPWKGFNEIYKLGLVDRTPIMHGIQPADCNPYVQSFQQGRDDVVIHPDPKSIALSIRDETGGNAALRAIYDSGGDATDVTDAEIIEAFHLLAHSGYLVEPSSAASVAGVIKAARAGALNSDEIIVCLVTGAGAKWPETMSKLVKNKPLIEPSWEEILVRTNLDKYSEKGNVKLQPASENQRPLIGITIGDPNGIGPEIITKILSQRWVYEICRPVVIGSDMLIKQVLKEQGEDNKNFIPLNLDVHSIDRPELGHYVFGTIDVLNVMDIKIDKLLPGQVQAEAGHLAVESVRSAAHLALTGDISAVVTAPINKEAIRKAGYLFAGHTELLAHTTGAKDYRLSLAYNGILVSHVTTHVSLKNAIRLLTEKEILITVELVGHALINMGIKKPRIAVCGLNPHAGEGGIFGDEEICIITPALNKARSAGWEVIGPLPPDTVFMRAQRGNFEGIVGMYHDQGHIPVKAIAFDHAVNVTLGLPIIRTSVDHGTAFDIAGKGIANPKNLGEALKMAVNIVNKRWSWGPSTSDDTLLNNKKNLEN
tara:strand:- start:11659 stop:14019 length:2361 start_codon:yes stop_codon:yes gene_type:complete